VSLDNYAGILTEKGKTAADMVIRAIVEPIGPLLARHDSVAIIGNGTIAIVGEIKAAAVESGVIIPSASIGIAKVTGNYVVAEDILRDAGIALHAAQAAGRDQTMLFHRGMDEVVNQTPIAI
jgi:GGDEF domain-containing protein